MLRRLSTSTVNARSLFKLITGLQIQPTLVKDPAGIDLPQRRQNPIEKLTGIFIGDRRGELSSNDIERLLNNLKADLRATVRQRAMDQGLRSPLFATVVFVE